MKNISLEYYSRKRDSCCHEAKFSDEAWLFSIELVTKRIQNIFLIISIEYSFVIFKIYSKFIYLVLKKLYMKKNFHLYYLHFYFLFQ